jgi:hypothetical protein
LMCKDVICMTSSSRTFPLATGIPNDPEKPW